MTTTYEASGCWKLSVEDDFEEGPIEDISSAWISHKIVATDLDGVKSAIMSLSGCNAADIIVNPCEDEPGLIEVQVLENSDGIPLTPSETAKWTGGEIRAWLCTYSWSFEKVTREPANFD